MKICNRLKQFVKLLLVFPVLGSIFLSAACQKPSPPPELNQEEAQKNLYDTPIEVGGKKIYVQIVSLQKEMDKGLSGREKLTEEQGMLFKFSTPERVNFWMKDMYFDLDLIWIKNKKIVGITADVPHPKLPGDVLPLYPSPTEVDMVLEVNAGWSERNEIKVGNFIEIKN